MRNFYMACLLFGVTFSAASSASTVCNNGYGEVTCSKGSVDSVNANGVAKMDGTTVLQHTQVNGSLQAQKVVLNTLTVNGDTSMSNSTVNKAARVNGALKARNTKFLSTLTIASNNARLDKCETKDITIEKIDAPKQALKLTSTNVEGSIKFNGNNGFVYLCKGSKITGSVSGGKIVENCK